MSERSFKVLVVEDEPDVAAFIKKLLEKKFSVEVETTPNLSFARVLIEAGGFDVVTMDYQLPDGDGIALLEEIAASSSQPPVIVITGHGDEKTAVRAFKSGAAGYVVKDARMHSMLPDAFEKVLSGIRLDEVSLQLADNAEQLALILDNVPMIIARVNDQRCYIYANCRFAEAFDTSAEELVGKHVREAIGEEAYRKADPYIDMVLAGRALSFKAQLPTGQGDSEYNLSLVPRFDEDDSVKDYFIFGQAAAPGVTLGITPAG